VAPLPASSVGVRYTLLAILCTIYDMRYTVYAVRCTLYAVNKKNNNIDGCFARVAKCYTPPIHSYSSYLAGCCHMSPPFTHSPHHVPIQRHTTVLLSFSFSLSASPLTHQGNHTRSLIPGPCSLFTHSFHSPPDTLLPNFSPLTSPDSLFSLTSTP